MKNHITKSYQYTQYAQKTRLSKMYEKAKVKQFPKSQIYQSDSPKASSSQSTSFLHEFCGKDLQALPLGSKIFQNMSKK